MTVKIYRYFSRHKALLWTLLIASSVFFLFFGLKMEYVEDVSSLVPNPGKGESGLAFNSLKVKDKIFLQFPSATPDEVDAFMEGLLQKDSTIANVLYKVESSVALEALGFALDHLPSFVSTDAYPAFDKAITQADATMARNYEQLMEDETGRNTQMITMDPLALREQILPLDGLGSGFTFKDGHLYSAEGNTLLAFVSPDFSYQNSKASEALFEHIEAQIKESGIEVLVHGTPIRSVGNARTIKKDLATTIGLSFLLILLFLCLSFKSVNILWQNALPVGYGTAFALAVMYWIKGSMSLMAFGICAVVLGVAISYCLHIIIHHRFVGDIEQLLRDESKPVFLGCLTTVGAFLGLLFTKSELLRDFGLFATLALVGSTFFALVFLPHLLKEGDTRRNSTVLKVVDRINNAPYDRTPWFIGALVLVIVVGLAFSGKVRFDNDLRHIGYESEQLHAAMDRYNKENQGGKTQRYYAATGVTLDEALEQHKAVRRVIDSLKAEGCIGRSQDLVSLLFIPEAEQRTRIAAWNSYWTAEKRADARQAIDRAARRKGLDPSLFDPFFSLLDVEFEPASLYKSGVVPEGLLCNFIENSADRYLVFSPVLLDEDQRPKVDDALAPVALVVDPMYYTGSLVELTHRDFNAALLLSSLFVLVVLLLSFRNVWVALLAFLPMGLSWYVVQGWMAIFGLEFNLLNIVISTFVFGIGVDYSIFVMQGLLAGALGKDNRLLQYHKTAIFFSAFVLLVVILSLLLALHPAIRSIGWCSLIGMGSTILITYSLQPLLFRQMLRLPFIRKTIIKF